MGRLEVGNWCVDIFHCVYIYMCVYMYTHTFEILKNKAK